MSLVIRGNPETLRSSAAFSLSGTVHLAILTWLLVSAGFVPLEKPRSIYDQEIKPNESRLIWYNVRKQLPSVRPSAAADAPKPPRALKKFDQQLVAGPKDLPRPPQMIQLPAPEIELAKPLPLPNLLAAPAPRLVRAFNAPPDRPQPKPAQTMLPEAPKLDAATQANKLALDIASPRPKPLPFTPPAARNTEAALPVLPSAPTVEQVAPSASMPRIPKGFNAPAGKRPASSAAEPTLSADVNTLVNPDAARNTPSSLAIAGLNPTNTTDIPPPPGSHQAGFSGGPQLRPNGSQGETKDGILVVPGLFARGDSKDTQPTLVASLPPIRRPNLGEALRSNPVRLPAEEPDTRATRVTSAPDPRLRGRLIYTVAIQMPNITSYSGSWLVWFAEHQPQPGAPPLDMRSPVALHKVDPKYVRSAVDEKIEGTVRLYAVIRKSGAVDSVEVIKPLDQRLDQTAAEALVKWQFEPARRDGTPIDVDAVFEIPFRLAPKLNK